MKKVYVSHASGSDFKKELYEPLKALKGVELVLPHEKSDKPAPSKEIIRKCSTLIADVSQPSHGVGIEIGWADAFGVPIILISKKGSKVSSSLKIVSDKHIEYDNVESAVPKLQRLVY